MMNGYGYYTLDLGLGFENGYFALVRSGMRRLVIGKLGVRFNLWDVGFFMVIEFFEFVI